MYQGSYETLIGQAQQGDFQSALTTAISMMAQGEQMETILASLVDVMSETDLTEFATQLGIGWVAYQQAQGVPDAAISAMVGTPETASGGPGLDPGSAEGIMASKQYDQMPGALRSRFHVLGREYRQNASRSERQAQIAAEALAILRVLALRDNFKEPDLMEMVEGLEAYSIDTFGALARQAANEQYARENDGRQPWRNPMQHPVAVPILAGISLILLIMLWAMAGLPPFGG
jgi:hypothetical protein